MRFRTASLIVLWCAASLAAQHGPTPQGPIAIVDTPHLFATAAINEESVTPGKGSSVVVDVEPRRGMHVYAPGKHTYRAIKIAFDPQPWLRVDEAGYPKAEIYHFKPLDERVEVYMKPFRMSQAFTVLATPAAAKLLAGRDTITITGRLEYQACDDAVCYRPQSALLKFDVPLAASKR